MPRVPWAQPSFCVLGQGFEVCERNTIKIDKADGSNVEHVIVQTDRGVSWEAAVERLENTVGQGRASFYKSRKPFPGYPSDTATVFLNLCLLFL